MPGARSALTEVLPLAIVSEPAISLPFCSIATLCSSAEGLSKSIVTLPGLLRLVVSKASSVSEAASCSVPPGPVAALLPVSFSPLAGASGGGFVVELLLFDLFVRLRELGGFRLVLVLARAGRRRSSWRRSGPRTRRSRAAKALPGKLSTRRPTKLIDHRRDRKRDPADEEEGFVAHRAAGILSRRGGRRRQAARRLYGRLAPPAAGSAGSDATGASPSMPSAARTLVSISRAISGLSARNCLALLRPWPSRVSP